MAWYESGREALTPTEQFRRILKSQLDRLLKVEKLCPEEKNDQRSLNHNLLDEFWVLYPLAQMAYGLRANFPAWDQRVRTYRSDAASRLLSYGKIQNALKLDVRFCQYLLETGKKAEALHFVHRVGDDVEIQIDPGADQAFQEILHLGPLLDYTLNMVQDQAEEGLWSLATVFLKQGEIEEAARLMEGIENPEEFAMSYYPLLVEAHLKNGNLPAAENVVQGLPVRLTELENGDAYQRMITFISVRSGYSDALENLATFSLKRGDISKFWEYIHAMPVAFSRGETLREITKTVAQNLPADQQLLFAQEYLNEIQQRLSTKPAKAQSMNIGDISKNLMALATFCADKPLTRTVFEQAMYGTNTVKGLTYLTLKVSDHNRELVQLGTLKLLAASGDSNDKRAGQKLAQKLVDKAPAREQPLLAQKFRFIVEDLSPSDVSQQALDMPMNEYKAHTLFTYLLGKLEKGKNLKDWKKIVQETLGVTDSQLEGLLNGKTDQKKRKKAEERFNVSVVTSYFLRQVLEIAVRKKDWQVYEEIMTLYPFPPVESMMALHHGFREFFEK